jgi:hypothetical protein
MTTTQEKEPKAPEKGTTPDVAPAPRKPESEPKPKSRKRETATPVLRFSPTAWAKLLFFRDAGETEIGGFGITPTSDLLLVMDFVTVHQKAGTASIAFDDDAVADYFESQVDAGRRPEQFGRIWLHSHPGDSAQPSAVDEETFRRVFGRCEWAVMFVVSRSGKTHARLRFNAGPTAQVVIPVEVDYGCAFGPSDHDAWKAEYTSNVRTETWTWSLGESYEPLAAASVSMCTADEWLEAFEAMEPCDRRFVIDEIAAKPELWDEESEGVPW